VRVALLSAIHSKMTIGFTPRDLVATVDLVIPGSKLEVTDHYACAVHGRVPVAVHTSARSNSIDSSRSLHVSTARLASILTSWLDAPPRSSATRRAGSWGRLDTATRERDRPIAMRKWAVVGCQVLVTVNLADGRTSGLSRTTRRCPRRFVELDLVAVHPF